MRIYLIVLTLFFTASTTSAADFVRGDANCDSNVNLSDATTIWQWWQQSVPQGCDCQSAMDVNDDGSVNGADISYLTNYLFSSGPEIPAPFPNCGTVSGANCNEATGGC